MDCVKQGDLNMNSISWLFRRYRAVSWLGAASIISIFATNALAQIVPPPGVGTNGQLRLQMGNSMENHDPVSHAPRRFVHYPSGMQQTINTVSKCILAFGGPYDLTSLSSNGGNGSGEIGVGTSSLGVPDGPKGVACYRFGSAKSEEIEFSLGADTIDPSIIGAKYFYGLELDIEVKKNANLFLEVLNGSTVVETYELRTGSSIDPALLQGRT